jgi:hypothetical protein
MLAGTSAAAGHHLDLLSGDRVDVFVSASRAPGVECAHALEPVAGAEANVVLRLVPEDAWPLIAGRRLGVSEEPCKRDRKDCSCLQLHLLILI